MESKWPATRIASWMPDDWVALVSNDKTVLSNGNLLVEHDENGTRLVDKRGNVLMAVDSPQKKYGWPQDKEG